MSKRPLLTLQCGIHINHDYFDHIDGAMQAVAEKNKHQWEEDLYFAVKFAYQMLSNYYAKVTLITGMLPISVNILHSFWILQSFSKLVKWINIDLVDETLYTTQYHEALVKYVENECYAKHILLPVIILKAYWAIITSPAKYLLALVDHLLINISCPVMLINN
jgi:hypothetical protein